MVNIVINSLNRTKTKTYNSLPYHFYTEQNFNNSFNKSYDIFVLNYYYWSIKTKLTMKNLYLDDLFTYY